MEGKGNDPLLPRDLAEHLDRLAALMEITRRR